MRSCERPLNRSARDHMPSSVSKRYSLSIRTQGSLCRHCASSSLRRVSSFSALSSSSRAASHSSRVPVLCFVFIALLCLLPSLLRPLNFSPFRGKLYNLYGVSIPSSLFFYIGRILYNFISHKCNALALPIFGILSLIVNWKRFPFLSLFPKPFSASKFFFGRSFKPERSCLDFASAAVVG